MDAFADDIDELEQINIRLLPVGKDLEQRRFYVKKAKVRANVDTGLIFKDQDMARKIATGEHPLPITISYEDGSTYIDGVRRSTRTTHGLPVVVHCKIIRNPSKPYDFVVVSVDVDNLVAHQVFPDERS